ncbi:MAG TPA: hypothetical protein EYQ00_05200 [Dehalococcoidia bacterium]|nr:hypothetical protein [Dehalococcoidia bacterium]
MPSDIKKKSCKQSDGSSGSYVLSYTDKKGKKHNNCHTSKKKAHAQTGYIDELDEADIVFLTAESEVDETDDMVFGGGGDAEEDEEGELTEALLREWIREKLLAEATLQASELYKRPTAVEEYLKRVKESIPFELNPKAGSGTITIPPEGNEALVAALELYATDPARSSIAFNAAWSAGVQTSDGTKTASGMLQKTKDFGGERAGKRTEKESIQVDQINAAIKAAGGSVSVDLGGRGGVVHGIAKCDQVTSSGRGGKDPKADAILLTADGTKVGELSLKYAGAPNQMSQWGGVSELYTAKVEYVVEFIKDVKYLEDKLGRLDQSYYREIKDTVTAKKICFGGGGDLYNVGAIIASQTPITIGKKGFAAAHVWTYPNIPDGDWYPTLWARFSTGRGGSTESLQNVRLSLSPKGARKGVPLPERPVTEEVEAPPPAEVAAAEEPVQETILRALIRESLLFEDLTGTDKSEIKRMIGKEIESVTNRRQIEKVFNVQFDKQLRTALGTSFFGTPGKINKFVIDAINDEVARILGTKATRTMVVDITKDVIIRLYRELSFQQEPVIRRMNV